MDYRERIISATQQATNSFLRAVRATPKDRLEWQVMDQGRTVLDQFQECAQAPTMFTEMLNRRNGSPFAPEDFPKIRAERKTWSFEDCERKIQENTERFYAAVRNVPDEDLEQVLTLPFGNGMQSSLAEIMVMPYWNLTYHLGQVNFIQTLLGDWDMH